MPPKIHDSATPRNPSPLEAMVRAIAADEARKQLAALSGPRWVRCSDRGVSHKQRSTLEPHGVRFAKIGKVWCYDASTLEAYVAVQAGQRAERAAAANDAAPDPLDAIDPSVAAVVRRVVGGSR